MTTRRPNKALEEKYIADGGCCYYCDTPTPFEKITRDHLLPKSEGHPLDNNTVWACKRCNGTKSNLSLEDFRKLIIKKIISLLKKVVEQEWKISDEQLEEMRYRSRMLKRLTTIIKTRNK